MNYKKISSLFFMMIMLITGVWMSGNPETTQNKHRDVKTQIVGEEIFQFANEQRTQHYQESLSFNNQLMEAAQKRAEDMAAKGYFNHTAPDGRKFESWVRDAGYDFAYVAENLAVKFIYSKSVVNAWMNSESHRATLLSGRYTEIGIGIALGEYKGTPALFVAAIFGEPTIPKEIRDQLINHSK